MSDRTSKVIASHPSPFFRRSYGGFTRGQIGFYTQLIDFRRKRVIVDPMGGQAVALSQLSWAGHDVWVGDINPALLFLAGLRDPEVIINRDKLALGLRKKLDSLQRKKRVVSDIEFIDDWFAPTIRDDLRDFGEMTSLPLFDDPFSWENKFWGSSIQSQFEIGVVLLAARSIACMRKTDNPTWSRPGGLVRESRLAPSVRNALLLWEAYASKHESVISLKRRGAIVVRRTNVSKGLMADIPSPHAIITSPPYANRLDYTKLWAPESEALAIMCNRSISEIRRGQMGSTVMRGKLTEIEASPRALPGIADRTLERIRNDKAASSHNYYYPFFRTYAEDLVSGIRTTAQRLRKHGIFVIFVRDTVRKDILFPTGQIVVDVLQDEAGLELIDERREIIKGHVGQLRQQTKSGLYGLAQQEWWLAFRRVL